MPQILDVLKYLVPAGPLALLAGAFAWWRKHQEARNKAIAQLRTLSAEVERNRELVVEYVRDVRARFHYLTRTARMKQGHPLAAAIRDVLPDERIPEIGAYMYSGIGKGGWFYRSGPPDWPDLVTMDEPLRHETAIRFLREPELLDQWDHAVVRLKRNRDGLAETWQRLEAQPVPEYPTTDAATAEEWSAVNAAIDRRYEATVFEVIDLATGMLAGADEAERIGADLADSLRTAETRIEGLPTRFMRWLKKRLHRGLVGQGTAENAARIAQPVQPEGSAHSSAERIEHVSPGRVLLFPGMVLRIPAPGSLAAAEHTTDTSSPADAEPKSVSRPNMQKVLHYLVLNHDPEELVSYDQIAEAVDLRGTVLEDALLELRELSTVQPVAGGYIPFAWVKVLARAWEHANPGVLDFDVRADKLAVARSVAAQSGVWLDGPTMTQLTGLPPKRINIAALALREDGALILHRAAGRNEYAFRGVCANHRTRQLVRG